MRDGKSNEMQVIKKLELAFGRHRRRNDGKRSYPEKLKDMAIAAVDSGVAGRAVAAAAGVAPQSLLNWRTGGGVESPRELKVVSGHEELSPDASINSFMARVTLPSGITIEVPTSALTATLINALNGGVV
jgi:hypothetical protein